MLKEEDFMYENFKKPFILVTFGFSNFLITLHGKDGVIYADSTFSTKIPRKDKLSKETFVEIFDKALESAVENDILNVNVYISGESHNEKFIPEELEKKKIEATFLTNI